MGTKPAAWPFATPDDMLAKAYRDLGRLVAAELALHRDDAIDGTINACLAAWSVSDMVRKLGLTKRSKEDFYAHLRNVSPEINLCRDIAEFYKHFELRRPDTTIVAEGVSVAHAIALGPIAFTFTPAMLNFEKLPFAPPPEDPPPAPTEPEHEPDVAAIEAEDGEAASSSTPSHSLSVKIRLRDGSKRAAAEVVEKAIKDWDDLLKSGKL